MTTDLWCPGAYIFPTTECLFDTFYFQYDLTPLMTTCKIWRPESNAIEAHVRCLETWGAVLPKMPTSTFPILRDSTNQRHSLSLRLQRWTKCLLVEYRDDVVIFCPVLLVGGVCVGFTSMSRALATIPRMDESEMFPHTWKFSVGVPVKIEMTWTIL